jgi:PKD repeat protein
VRRFGVRTDCHGGTGLNASTTYSYRVRADNAGGPSPYTDEAQATTQALPPNNPPDAKYTWKCGGTNGTDGRTCDFDGSTSNNGDGGKVSSYFWEFNDNNATSTAEKPRRRFSTNGTFPVKLTVKDQFNAQNVIQCNVTTGRGKTGTCD